MSMKKSLMTLAALVAVLGAGQVFADHDRRLVVRETYYSTPVVTYHSGPVSVYVGPSHTMRVITTSNRYNSHHHDWHRPHAYGHRKSHGYGHRKSHGYGHRYHDSYDQQRHYGGFGRFYQGYYDQGYYDDDRAPSRGSWSRDRREVIYVNKDARKHSNYRRVERNSVVIRERRR